MAKNRCEKSQLTHGAPTFAFKSSHGQSGFEVGTLSEGRAQPNDTFRNFLEETSTQFRCGGAVRVKRLLSQLADLAHQSPACAVEHWARNWLLVVRIDRIELTAFAAHRSMTD
ncbi:hypothetical protein D3C80_1871070 [compost metagenome]